MTVPATETAATVQEINLDPKLGEKIQVKNLQMMTAIFAVAIVSIIASASLFGYLGLLHDWMMYIPLALGVAVGYFGQQLNEKSNAKRFADATRNTHVEIREYISKTYGIMLKDDVKLETVRVGEKEKIRIDPASLPATDQITGDDVRVSVTFTPDYKQVVACRLSNEEWFEESVKLSES